MTWPISIIIPVLNEATSIVAALQALQPLRTECQIIVVDGGSQDDTVALATQWVDCVLKSAKGRAVQMNQGATKAQAAILVFLHCDTHLPKEAVPHIQRALAKDYQWGRCDVAFDSPKCIFQIIATMMNIRSRVTGIATGDQAMFMTRAVYEAVDGFPELALMEDIAMSARLKKMSRPYCLKINVITSARRWLTQGIMRTILLMWWLRLRFFLGAHPDQLAALYYPRH